MYYKRKPCLTRKWGPHPSFLIYWELKNTMFIASSKQEFHGRFLINLFKQGKAIHEGFLSSSSWSIRLLLL
jgi:hypothetical protein